MARRVSIRDVKHSLNFQNGIRQYVKLGTTFDFDSNDATIAFWGRLRESAANTGSDRIFYQHSGEIVLTQRTSGGGNLATQLGTGYTDFSYIPPLNEWVFYTMTWDFSTGNVELFAFGVSQGSATITGTAASGGGAEHTLGTPTTASTHDGDFTQPITFDRILTDTEIADLYFDAVKPSGAVVDLSMDEGIGTSLANDGSAPAGTITGTEDWSFKVPSRSRYSVQDFDYSLHFEEDGDNCELTVTNVEVDPTADYTAMWAMKYPSAVSEDGPLIGQENGAASILALTTLLSLRSFIDGGVNIFSTTPPIGKWFRIVVRHNAAGKTVKIDTALMNGDRLVTADTITYSGTPSFTASNKWQWGSNGASNQAGMFKGAEFRLFASELSDAQIDRYLSAGVAPTSAVEELLLPEGSGTTTANTGLNGGNAIVSSAPVWNTEIPSQTRVELSQARAELIQARTSV